MISQSGYPADQLDRYRKRLLSFLVLSLIMHLYLLGNLDALFERPEPAPVPAPMAVKFAPAQAQQIVDAPEVNSKAPVDDAFLGTRDQAVQQEMIARQTGKAANADVEAAPEQPEKQAAKSSGLELAKLLPDPYGAASAAAQASRQMNAIDRQFGDVTLLNTKSHPYSAYLIDRGYRAVRLLSLNAELTSWYRSDLSGVSFPAVVRADIDANGTILTDGIERSSGSRKIDRLLLNALRGAVRGSAPPPEAFENGRLQVVLALDSDIVRIGIR